MCAATGLQGYQIARMVCCVLLYVMCPGCAQVCEGRRMVIIVIAVCLT